MKSPLTPIPAAPAGLASTPAEPRWNVLPFPSHTEAKPAAEAVPSPLPEIPSDGLFPTSWPAPGARIPVIPAPTDEWAIPEAVLGKSAAVETEEPALDSPFSIDTSVPPVEMETVEPEELPDFTDEDLREAFGPIVEGAVRKAVYAKENGIDTYLEPMLRATIRRALAEHTPSARPFHSPGTFDRFLWHMKALFTSRTYEEIVFEKTRRFQVEEVFLFDVDSLALVSFASSDPARHASVRRVSGSAQRIATMLRGPEGMFRPSFEVADRRKVIARQGRHVVLAAILRGSPGELVNSDLEYALRRIEDLFRDQFEASGSALLHELQPFLEECLLIQAPATAA
ncbi:MAG: hypothetical protein H7A48_15415 [Akkermansiaceae bacterium]|nr:hypothetical protein [Akkermansiaceae bacterium]